MTFEVICETCRALPATTEDVKWGNDLVFSVGEKMYAAMGLENGGLGFKCTPERFEELTQRPGIVPAPYLARAHWISIKDASALSDAELTELLTEAHRTIAAKLPKRLQKELGIGT